MTIHFFFIVFLRLWADVDLAGQIETITSSIRQ
jgi:hypothetical protein